MKTAVIASCIIALTGMSTSRAAVVASDDFSYADGNLAGKNGGTGFSGSWSAGSEERDQATFAVICEEARVRNPDLVCTFNGSNS